MFEEATTNDIHPVECIDESLTGGWVTVKWPNTELTARNG